MLRSRYWVCTLFFASGISGLMYQVVWLRMLSRTTGVSIHATATVVAAFMAGLALGTFVLGKLADKRNDPLRIYALLELSVAAAAFVVPYVFEGAVPLYRFLYQWSAESVTVTAVGMGCVSFLTLLVPTALMGGTLPVMTTFLVRKDSLLGKNLSMLYGLNTLGAVTGVVLSSFLFIGLFGERVTTYIGITINLLVAVIALYVFKKDRDTVTSTERPTQEPLNALNETISPYSKGIPRLVLFAVLLSGVTALAYEVIWTRQLILFLDNSIYAFSAMLAVFLAGVSLGSLAIKRFVDKLRSPLTVFGVLELAIGIISVFNLYLFAPIDSFFVDKGMSWQPRFLATVILVFPMTFIFGLIFPIAGRCYDPTVEKTGAWIGRLYGFNTVGCIVGSLCAGFLLIPTIGSTNTVILLAAVNLILGAVLLWAGPAKSAMLRFAVAPACVIFLIPTMNVANRDPFLGTIEKRIRDGRSRVNIRDPRLGTQSEIFFNKEGIEGTVTAFAWGSGKHFWVNGLGMTSLCTETKLMAHLPLMFAKDPKEFLVVCFGMGTTVKSAAVYPGLNVTAVELVSEAFETFRYFHPNSDALKKENVRLVANDGRNHLLLSPKKYDVISVDPAPPVWSARTVNLYTREFFQLCKSRLTPDGVMCLWFSGSLRENDACLVRTFSSVFPYTSAWSGPNYKRGFFLVGTMKKVPLSEFKRNVDNAFGNAEILKDLREYDTKCDSPEKLFGLAFLNESQAESIGQETSLPLITDDYPLTEFFLWRH